MSPMRLVSGGCGSAWLWRALGVMALGVMAASAGGCAVVGVAAYKLMGPAVVPPRFTPALVPTVVLVEPTRESGGAMPEADELAVTIYSELQAMKVAPMIDPQRLNELRAANPVQFPRWSISEIGRKVGAQQVIYVELRVLTIEAPPGTEVVRLLFEARVKVVQPDTAMTLWPETEEGEPFEFKSPFTRMTAEMSAPLLRRQVLRQAGVEVARWFYPYKPETMGEEYKDMRLR